MTRVFQTEVDSAELQPGDIVISLVDNRGEIRVVVEREVAEDSRTELQVHSAEHSVNHDPDCSWCWAEILTEADHG